MTVAIRPQHHFGGLALPVQVHQHRDLNRVVIVGVVRRELEMPLERAGVRVECDHRVGVQVVAGALIGVPVRTRIADAPVGEIEFRVVRPGDPHRATAVFPGVAGPGIVPGLAGSWNRVEAPRFFSRFRVEGRDEAADAELGPADADDHFVFHDERGHRDRVRQLHVGNGDVPEWMAVFRVDRDQMRVERAHEHGVAQDRDASVVGAAADPRLGHRRVPVLPEHPTRPGIDGHDVVRTLSDVHHPVGNDGVRLPGAEHFILQNPFGLEVRDVGRRDLREQAMPLAGVRAAVGQPVLRL